MRPPPLTEIIEMEKFYMSFGTNELKELANKLRKLEGLYPYNTPDNQVYGDGIYAKSLEEKYGKPISELMDLCGLSVKEKVNKDITSSYVGKTVTKVVIDPGYEVDIQFNDGSSINISSVGYEGSKLEITMNLQVTI